MTFDNGFYNAINSIINCLKIGNKSIKFCEMDNFDNMISLTAC